MGVSATMATGQVVEVGRNDCAVPPGTRGVWLGVVPETGNALVLLAGGRRVALLAGQWRPEGGEWPVLRLAADLLGPDPEGEGLMREFPAAAQPPLLPPLTAVQRAWVVAAAAVSQTGGNWFALYTWALGRWGKPRAEMLWSLSDAVGRWRDEQEGARDA